MRSFPCVNSLTVLFYCHCFNFTASDFIIVRASEVLQISFSLCQTPIQRKWDSFRQYFPRSKACLHQNRRQELDTRNQITLVVIQNQITGIVRAATIDSQVTPTDMTTAAIHHQATENLNTLRHLFHPVLCPVLCHHLFRSHWLSSKWVSWMNTQCQWTFWLLNAMVTLHWAPWKWSSILQFNFSSMNKIWTSLYNNIFILVRSTWVSKKDVFRASEHLYIGAYKTMAFFEEAVDTIKMKEYNLRTVYLDRVGGKEFYFKVKVNILSHNHYLCWQV